MKPISIGVTERATPGSPRRVSETIDTRSRHATTPDRESGSDSYKWTALTNTTLGVFMVTLDSSIVIISLPAIFRGIHLDPLQPSNIGYLLWMLQGYLVVTAVLVVTLGRLGDMFGRV